ncbi:hypothetical protein [Ilumatobacter nonamiensis]|uniref:hypothetical protein n=1 Tax=Ilumatobacter nonamiensis TaxID=467093 RepID=UPI000344F239|nr:hypothetical protein [Ilumatobacter nonamiensis]
MSADSDVERRLAELEAASDARRRELTDVMQQLPAEVSRRDVLRSGLHDLRTSDDVGSVIRRTARAVVGVPRAAYAWVRARLRR